jgi:hypothetical protein
MIKSFSFTGFSFHRAFSSKKSPRYEDAGCTLISMDHSCAPRRAFCLGLCRSEAPAVFGGIFVCVVYFPLFGAERQRRRKIESNAWSH